MPQLNPYNYLKGAVAKGCLLSGKFATKLLNTLSQDRVYPGKGLKETPGLNGRMLEVTGDAVSVVCPFQVEWDKKEVKVKHNWGTVAYFNETNGELKYWRPREEELKFAQTNDCYIYIEYIHSSKAFSVKIAANAPDHWSSDGDGNPTKATVIIAVIRDGKLRQQTFNSFIVAPFWTGWRGVMDFNFYPTIER